MISDAGAARMTIDEIRELVDTSEGTLAFTPGPDDGSPEIAWGDTFFYYAPDGTVPTATQPFATIITKDYPDDDRCGLNEPGRFRVNIGVGRAAFTERIGRAPHDLPGDVDASVADVLMARPVHGALGWVAVVDPGPATEATVGELLRLSYGLARARDDRRAAL